MSDATYDDVLALARQLSPTERSRLAREMMADMEALPNPPKPSISQKDVVREIRLKAYTKARQYWESAGNHERLALTDAELDEQFWLFDPEGIPRLKSDEGMVEIPENSLYRLGEAAEKYGFGFGPGDVSERSREILNTEFVDHLRKRMNSEPE